MEFTKSSVQLRSAVRLTYLRDVQDGSLGIVTMLQGPRRYPVQLCLGYLDTRSEYYKNHRKS